MKFLDQNFESRAKPQFYSVLFNKIHCIEQIYVHFSSAILYFKFKKICEISEILNFESIRVPFIQIPGKNVKMQVLLNKSDGSFFVTLSPKTKLHIHTQNFEI
jgi:hypothetical protein